MFFDPHRLRIEGGAVPAGPVRARCPGAGVRPLPRSRGRFSCISNRPDLRGIHAVFCLSFHPSCRLVASGRQSRWLLRRARLHTKMQKETRQTGCLLRLFISSARRKETPCHFIHSSPVNLSVLQNILHSFRNDRAHYALCFRRSSLTYSALTYFTLEYDITISDLPGAV